MGGPVDRPKDKIKVWKEVLERGPRIQALCIGVNAYKEWNTLKNAVADAEIIASNVSALPESRVREVCRNPATKASLEKAVSDFVLHIEKKSPPQICLIFYAGHGIQAGDRIYLVPTNAKKKNLWMRLNLRNSACRMINCFDFSKRSSTTRLM